MAQAKQLHLEGSEDLAVAEKVAREASKHLNPEVRTKAHQLLGEIKKTTIGITISEPLCLESFPTD